MKKIFNILLMLLVAMVLVACGSSTEKEAKTYDEDFIKSLAKGLDNRWSVSDSASFEENAKSLAEVIQKELDEVGSYTDKKFSSSELQEQAIAYINELNKGLEVAATYGADSFYIDWDKHANARTSIILKINSIKEIPVKDKNILNQLLAKGKEATQKNAKETAVNDLVSNLTYQLDEAKSDEFVKVYFVEVENTTEYLIKDLGISVNLVNDSGVTVETTYINMDNWKSGSKVRLEFSVYDKEFAKTETTLEYYTAE